MSKIIDVIDFVSPVGVDSIFLGKVVIPDGTWVTEGKTATHIPGDRDHREAGKRGAEFSEEVFIIANAPYLNGSVVRHVKSIIFNRSPWSSVLVATSDCLWASANPFAVLVKQMLRTPGDLYASCDFRIYWSKQLGDNDEAGRPIPIPVLPVTLGLDAGGEEQRWVNLVDLAKAAMIEEPRAITAGFLAYTVFGPGSTQPAFVHAKDVAALKTGPIHRFPSVKLTSGTRQTTSFLKGVSDSIEEVPPATVWVAELSAEKVLRIVSLGIKHASDLIPGRII